MNNLRKHYGSIGDFLLGLTIGMALALLILSSLGTPKYTIESVAKEEGIEYTIYSTVWVRHDVIYKTMSSDVAWSIWFGLYANREGVGYELPDSPTQPQDNDGVYNPDDIKKGKLPLI